MSRSLTVVVFLLAFVLASTPGPRAQSNALRGFPADAVAAQRQREAEFRKVPDSAKLREYMAVMAGEPHVAGRPGSQRVADYALQQFKSWGLDARIESFEALMPWPTERLVEMVAPTRVTLAIKEPALSEDPRTGKPVFDESRRRQVLNTPESERRAAAASTTRCTTPSTGTRSSRTATSPTAGRCRS